MLMRYRQCVGRRVRTAIYRQMEMAGLLSFAMSAWTKPTLKDWLALTTRSDGVVLLRCEDESGQILGCGLFTRQPYRVWQFDFTAFRAGFAVAAQQARGGFQWVFEHLDCTSIMGVCPLPNRHAWKLAEACGFRVLARLPEACFTPARATMWSGRAGALHPSVVDERRANLVSAVAAKPHTDKGPRDREQGQTTMYG